MQLDRTVSSWIRWNAILQQQETMPPSLKKCESQYKCYSKTYPFLNVWPTDQIEKKLTDQDCKNSKPSLGSAKHY